MPAATARRGFTLFEVMISMLILAVSVLSVALMLPSGLRSQEAARFKAVAAVTALNLINMFEQANPAFAKIESEAFDMHLGEWATNEPARYDIERYLTSSYHARNAIVPLPPDIARRIDSDGDLIQQILDEGGYVYFPSPLPSRLADFGGSLRKDRTSFNVAEDAVPYAFEGFDEAQRLVIGFVGHAQQNATPLHPVSAAPYRDWFPNAPIHRTNSDSGGYRIKGRDLGLGSDDYYDLKGTEAQSALTDLQGIGGDGGDTSSQNGNPDHAAWAMWTSVDLASSNGPAVWNAYVAMFKSYAQKGEEGQLPDLRDRDAIPGAQLLQTRWTHPNPDGNSSRESLDYYFWLVPRVEDYLLNAKALLDLTGLPTSFDHTTDPDLSVITHFDANSDGVVGPSIDGGGAMSAEGPTAYQVAALRYYADAAMWWSRFVRNPAINAHTVPNHDLDGNSLDAGGAALNRIWGNQDDGAPDVSVAIPAIPEGGLLAAIENEYADAYELRVTLTDADCAAIHEHALRWATHHQAHRPYDWGTFRPNGRAVMVDTPLMQQDLFDASGNWDPSGASPQFLNYPVPAGTGGGAAYRIATPRGCSAPYGGNRLVAELNGGGVALLESTGAYISRDPGDVPAGTWGNWYSHDKTWRRYAERMAKGWGDSDHVTLLDRFHPAERCRQMVIWAVDWQRYEDAELAPAAPTDASWFAWDSKGQWSSDDWRLRGRAALGYMGAYSQMLNWHGDPTGWLTDDYQTVDGLSLRILHRGTAALRSAGDGAGRSRDTIGAWVGRYGLDANGNNRFDRGSVPASMRMRATEVARFNLYDPRVYHGQRN